MILYRVLFDVEEPRRNPDESTPIRREERYFAAETVEAVWEAIAIDRLDEGMRFVALIEQAPSVCVLPPIGGHP